MKLLYKVRVIIAHPPLSLAADQYEEILEEVPYTLTARNSDELHDHLLDDANNMGVTIRYIHVEDKKETN